MPEDGLRSEAARALGCALALAGYDVINGGLAGVMEAAAVGVAEARRQAATEGRDCGNSIALLPAASPSAANPFAGVVIPTGLGRVRGDVLAASCDAMVAIGGRSGTLHELTAAWGLRRMLIAMPHTGGTAAEYAGRKADTRPRFPRGSDAGSEDRVFAAASADEVLLLLKQRLRVYVANARGAGPSAEEL